MSFSTKCATVQTCPGHNKPMQKEFQNKMCHSSKLASTW